jgi:aspartate/methionine/tyrosine aminotransferase
MKLEHTDLTYGKSILGSERIFETLSSFYSRYFSPLTPVKPSHIATSNGMSSMIEHLATVISDEEDGWLLPTPWYNGFKNDLEATAKVRIVSVKIQMGQEGELEEVEALDREMQRRKDQGVEQKITAVLVTNPHNPLGELYL